MRGFHLRYQVGSISRTLQNYFIRFSGSRRSLFWVKVGVFDNSYLFQVPLDQVLINHSSHLLFLRKNAKKEEGVMHEIEQVYTHPNFGPGKESAVIYDFELVNLKTPITYNKAVQPICLPHKNRDFDDVDCVITGWGNVDGVTRTKPKYLKQGEIKAMSNEKCAKYWPGTRDASELCAGGKDVTGCNGDSGGPLVCKNYHTNNWELAGVVSYGSANCPLMTKPTIFGRVTHVLDWIYDTTMGKVVAPKGIARIAKTEQDPKYATKKINRRNMAITVDL